MNFTPHPLIIPGLLDGSVTQIRVPMDPQPPERESTFWQNPDTGGWFGVDENTKTRGSEIHSPLGVSGDVLTCLEKWFEAYNLETYYYLDKDEYSILRFNPCHMIVAEKMPAYRSRLKLRVKRVWVSCIQGALFSHRAEIMGVDMGTGDLKKFWNAMHPEHPYDSNPWTFAAEVERISDD